jgi:hypothetical protein
MFMIYSISASYASILFPPKSPLVLRYHTAVPLRTHLLALAPHRLLPSERHLLPRQLLLWQLNIGHKAVFRTPACKAQNTAILAVLRGFATQQDGVLDGATVQGLAVGAINMGCRAKVIRLSPNLGYGWQSGS